MYICNDVPSFSFHETIKGFNVNVKVFTLNRNLDVVEFVVPSRVEAAEVGIDKADPKCIDRIFLTKLLAQLPQELYVANPQTFDWMIWMNMNLR